MLKDEFENIKRLLGRAEQDDLENVDCFTGINTAVFVPSTGFCRYSVRESHTHPSYSFFISLLKPVEFHDGNRITRAEPGKLYIIPPMHPHHEIPGETFTRFFAGCIEKTFFENELSTYASPPKISKPLSSQPHENLIPALRDYMTELNAPDVKNLNYIKALECRICHLIIRPLAGLKHTGDKTADRLEIDRSAEYINDNFSETISVPGLAASAGLSVSHFSRIFKSGTGLSPRDYIIKVRLDRAKTMLTKSGKNITEIAFLCGFSSSAHFSSLFRSKFGIHPTEFRKS